MNFQEYLHDIDDFEEALSINNTHFSSSLLSVENNTFTIGERIRGMNNVSPLATVKFFNQSLDDVYTKYYPDAQPPIEGSFTCISDFGSDVEPIIKTTVKDFYYYDIEDVKNFAFKVIIFSSKDATKLKESFEVSEPTGREILIFVEDNAEDSISATYGAVKISTEVLSFFNSKKENRIQYDVYDNKNLYAEIKAVIPELNDNQIKSLLRKGYIEDTRVNIIKTYFKIASFFSSGVSKLLPGLGILTNDSLRTGTSFLLEKVILLIEETKLAENRWQPKPPKLENGEVDKNYKYSPLISSGEDSNGILNVSEITKVLKMMLTDQNNFVRKVLNIKKDFRKSSQPRGFLEILYKMYLSAYDIMYDVITDLEEISNLDIVKYGIKTYNAFLCGVWNGLVDSVAGLFAMVKMIYDGITMGKDFIRNIDQYLPVLLEQFDEAVQAIKKISFTEVAKYISTKLKKINLTFDLVSCSYFVGYAYGFITSLIIEIIVGIVISGGTLSIAAIVNALVESIVGIFRLGFAAVKGVARAVRTFAKFVVKSIRGLIEGFQELLNFLKKGWPEIKKIVDEVFEALETYAKDTKGSLNSQIPLLGQAELRLYGNLLKAFFKPFKRLLLHYSDVLLVAKKWKSLNPMKALQKEMIGELLELRKLNKKGFNKNAAIMNSEVMVNGKSIHLEYKALAGDGVNGIGLCSNVNKDYVAKQLGMSVDELMTHYKTIDEYNKIVVRFHDSEHKIFSVFDDELLKLKAKFGENRVKVKNITIKTLYEPCNSCKKQIIIRHEMYNNAKVNVEAIIKNMKEYAKDNLDLKRLGLVKE